MVIKIRDTQTRDIVGTFSDFISLIWTERFNGYGDFELVTPLTKKHYDLLKMDRYVEIPTSTNLMVIESINIENISEEKDKKITVKGISFESILKKRIIYVWRDTQKGINLKSFLTYLVKENLSSSLYPDRYVDWVVLTNNLSDYFNEITIQTDINRGDNLGDAIFLLGGLYGFCPKTVFNPINKRVVIDFYLGVQRNITFGRNDYNISNARYDSSISDFKTSAIVAGSGEGANRTIVVVSRSTTEITYDDNGNEIKKDKNDYNGVERREIFVDARDIQRENGETKDQYISRLKERGVNALKENNKNYLIDGTITNVGKYLLNVDYKLGDIVRIKNVFNLVDVRITEIIQSWSDTGYEIYPSFETLNIVNTSVSETYNIE